MPGFQAELSIVVLEEAVRSPTKQRLRRCGNGEAKEASRAFRMRRSFSEGADFLFLLYQDKR
jgi:hypothetical protein